MQILTKPGRLPDGMRSIGTKIIAIADIKQLNMRQWRFCINNLVNLNRYGTTGATAKRRTGFRFVAAMIMIFEGINFSFRHVIAVFHICARHAGHR